MHMHMHMHMHAQACYQGAHGPLCPNAESPRRERAPRRMRADAEGPAGLVQAPQRAPRARGGLGERERAASHARAACEEPAVVYLSIYLSIYLGQPRRLRAPPPVTREHAYPRVTSL